MRPVALLLAIAGLLAAAGSASAATVLARVPSPTTVSALRGWLAYTSPDPGAKGTRLVLRSPAGRVSTPDIAPLDSTYGSFDLGTDRRDRLVVALARCSAPATCRLGLLSLATGREQPVANVHPSGVRLAAPSVWRGRLAWAQGPSSVPDVRTRMLSWPSSAPSVRLPGAPSSLIGELTGRPVTVKGANVFTLDLGPHGLAEGVYVPNPQAGICGDTQVRYVTLPRIGSRLLRSVTCGLAGAQITGPALSGERIGWQISCPGDDSGCIGRTGGAFRMDLRTGATEQQKTPGRYFSGFALDGTSAYGAEVFDEEECSRDTATSGAAVPFPCPVERLDPGAWAPLPARSG